MLTISANHLLGIIGTLWGIIVLLAIALVKWFNDRFSRCESAIAKIADNLVEDENCKERMEEFRRKIDGIDEMRKCEVKDIWEQLAHHGHTGLPADAKVTR